MILKVQKWAILSLVLILVCSLVLVGCTSSEPTTQEIIDKSIASTSNVNTYKFDITMNMNASGIIPGSSEAFNMSAAGDGMMDNVNKQMQMNFNADIDIPGMGKQTMPMSYYLVGDYMYMKISIPTMGEQWMKMKLDTNALESQDQMTQQLAMLQSAVEASLVGTEELDGKTCYKIRVTPNLEAIGEWLKSLQQTSNLSQMDMGDLELSKLIKQITIIEWIEKDSSLFAKAEIGLTLDLSAANPDAATPAESQATMEITETLRFKDYNKAVTITLPAEAQNAQEIDLNGE